MIRLLAMVLLCALKVATAQTLATPGPDARAQRVIVMVHPEVPMTQIRGGLVMRVQKSELPVDVDYVPVAVPGLDWPAMILDEVTGLFAKSYQELSFIPLRGAADELAGVRGRDDLAAYLSKAMDAHTAGSALVLSIRKFDDRPKPFLPMGLLAVPIKQSAMEWTHSRWEAKASFFVAFSALDAKGTFSALGGIGGATSGFHASFEGRKEFRHMAPFEGTVKELEDMISGSRSHELQAGIVKALQASAPQAMTSFKEAAEMERNGRPLLWNLPYLPRLTNSERLRDPSRF